MALLDILPRCHTELMDTVAEPETEPTKRRMFASMGVPSGRLAYVGPNWFASVMGTGIVATAGATLPFHVFGLHAFTLVVWVASFVLLCVLIAAFGLHWLQHPQVARSHGRDVAMAQFYGAPAMALMTVGAGALLVGHSLIGLQTAVDLDWVLWTVGTVLGLLTATVVPYRLFTQIEVRQDAAFGGWLMPIVPPMVSSATGALLVPHVHSISGRATLLYGCYAMFGMTLVASFIIITLIWSRLAHFGSSGTTRVPTLWIVLGPLGQSITAVGLLGANAHLAVTPELARSLSVFAIFGVPVWGFAVMWIVLAASLTVRTARNKLPFHLTWWSFTFPVGTFVIGTSRLALETQLSAFRWASGLAYIGLLVTWALVAVRTVHGGLVGTLFRAPVAAAGGLGPTAVKGNLAAIGS
jgi:C4-dicarboxylate transporter/malic acid transport protein